MASLMTSLVETINSNGEFSAFADTPHFKYSILVSGFRSRDLEHNLYYKLLIKTPSLHIYGQADKMVDIEWSKALAEAFSSPKVYQHSGGHVIPLNSEGKQVIREFVATHFQ